MFRTCRHLLLLAPTFAAIPLCAGDADYLQDVKPILRERCFACHGALKQESDLRVDTGASLRVGGYAGPAVVPGDLSESVLLQRVTSGDVDERMPPEGAALSAEEIRAIEAWIAAGAKTPADEQPEEDPNKHWAFQPPQKVDLPESADPAWNHNPIDRLIASGHQKHNLNPVDLVEKQLLLRRVYLDLIGLPPTSEQYAEFLADESPESYENVVDALLDSPHYGERGGRQWMDIWRYTDWYGLGAQVRNSQKHIWHWRDWIVESLNSDKGYDRMIVEMLAGDEIAPTNRDVLRATGYLARNYYLFNRTTWLDDTIEHTSKAFLGLTMNCTKCHDHKYDPISQVDYYRLRAIFEPHQVRIDALPGETDFEKNGLPRAFDLHPDVETYLHVRGDPKQPDDNTPLTPGVPAVLDTGNFAIHSVSLPPEAYRPDLQAFVLEDQLAAANRTIAMSRKQLESAEQTVANTQRTQSTLLTLRGLTANTSPNSVTPAELVWSDDFTSSNSDLWNTGPGTWSCADGNLLQSESGAERRYLRSCLEHPQDFLARVRFRIQGGQKWKSVGLAFDVHEGQEKLVYLSGVSPGSKLQVSFRNDDGQAYPAEGRLDRPVPLDQTYELTIAVRDRLMNILLDGQLAIVYQLPVDRKPGWVDLVSFDSEASFEYVEVLRLPEDVELVPAEAGTGKAGDKVLTLQQALAKVDVSAKQLAVDELRPDAIATAHAADRASLKQSGSPEDIAKKIREAASAARRLEFAQAELALAAVKQELVDLGSGGDEKERETLNEKLATATAALQETESALEIPGGSYTSLRASLKAPEGPDETQESQLAPYPASSTGRRTALARWMVSPNNPLTARVAVNHIWLRHFGQPLVESVSDFGRRAPTPPQHDLLDWLAVEFMESGWSIKQLHRLIVTSRLYKLDTSRAAADPQTLASDPSNEFYWCRTPIRMESQVIRDSLLKLADKLDTTLGGPTIDPDQKHAVYRRSLYFTHSRDDQHKFLSMFDDADILRCYRRSESIVPQQALTLANSELALRMSREITTQLQSKCNDASDEEFIAAAFELLVAKQPTESEVKTCAKFLAQLRALPAVAEHANPGLRARENLVQALINHNDFVTIR